MSTNMPPPIEGEFLGAYRARVGLPGSNTSAAESIIWSDGRWKLLSPAAMSRAAAEAIDRACALADAAMNGARAVLMIGSPYQRNAVCQPGCAGCSLCDGM